MATMGVRVNQGIGSSASTALADTLAKALFGDADAAREDALARSRLETDEYNRRQIEAATQWTLTRDEADAAALDAARRGEEDYGNILLEHLNRPNGSATAPAPTAPPAPVDLDDTLLFPDDAPIPSARPEPIAVEPESLLPEEAPIPGLRPAAQPPVDVNALLLPETAPIPGVRAHQPSGVPIQPQEVPPPLMSGLRREPDVSFSGYPMRDDRFPEYATAVPQTKPVIVPSSEDVAGLSLRPPWELLPSWDQSSWETSPFGQRMLDPMTLGNAMNNQVTGLPDELQPAPVTLDPLASVPPNLRTFGEGATQTQIPGRLYYQEPPAPVEPPAGPAGAGELPELAAVDLPPQALAPGYAGTPPVPELAPVDMPPVNLPEQSLQPGYSGTPPVPPVSPVDLPPAEPVTQTPSSVPGTVTPQPDGTAALTMPDGTQKVYTRDQIDGIAAMVAFSNDQAGQARAWTGQLDLMNRGQTADNTALISGQPTPRSSIFGTDEEIRLQTAVEAAKPPDLTKNILSSEGVATQELYVDPADGRIKQRAVPGVEGAAAPDRMGGTSDTQNSPENHPRRVPAGERPDGDRHREGRDGLRAGLQHQPAAALGRTFRSEQRAW